MGIFGNKKNIIIIIGFIWGLYSTLVTSSGRCSFWIEEYDDGWYLMEKFEDVDTTYGVVYDGPFDKKTAEDYMFECRKEALRFKKKYGTIYNLVPQYEDLYGTKKNMFIRIMIYLMNVTIMWLPIYFLYKFYKKLP